MIPGAAKVFEFLLAIAAGILAVEHSCRHSINADENHRPPRSELANPDRLRIRGNLGSSAGSHQVAAIFRHVSMDFE